MSRRFQHASRFLRENDAISALLVDIEHHAKLLNRVRRVLPAPIDAHCLHAALDGEVLTLTTDSPVWASRLRFFAPELLRGLPAKLGAITSVRVRIQPAAMAAVSGPTPKARLSAGAVEHLLEAAESTRDEEIANALRRLAKAGGELGAD